MGTNILETDNLIITRFSLGKGKGIGYQINAMDEETSEWRRIRVTTSQLETILSILNKVSIISLSSTYDYPILFKCNKCTWKGDLGDLIIVHLGKLVPPTCPKCFSQDIKIIRLFKL